MNKHYETPTAIVLLLENEAIVMSGNGDGDILLSWGDYEGGNS